MELLKNEKSDTIDRVTTGNSGYAEFLGRETSPGERSPLSDQPLLEDKREEKVEVVMENGGPSADGNLGVINLLFDSVEGKLATDVAQKAEGAGYSSIEPYEGASNGGIGLAPPSSAAEPISVAPYSVSSRS